MTRAGSWAATRPARTSYGQAGRGVRLHTAMRSAMAPLDSVADLVPEAGTVLDLGCGHGLLSVHLGLRAGARRVHGVDISVAKVDQARAAAGAAGLADRVGFEVVDGRWRPPADTYDAVLVCDVLYLLDPAAVDDLVQAALGSLRPGGRLVIKEIDTSPRWKHRVTMAQELVSVRLLRITDGASFNPRPLDQVRASLASAGLASEEVPLDRGYPYAHRAVVAGVDTDPGRLGVPSAP